MRKKKNNPFKQLNLTNDNLFDTLHPNNKKQKYFMYLIFFLLGNNELRQFLGRNKCPPKALLMYRHMQCFLLLFLWDPF